MFISIKPHVTEKSTLLEEGNQYVVIVPKGVNKVQIKQAIKQAYGVDVVRVNIMNSPKKTRLVGRGREMTKRPRQRKAVIFTGTETLDLSSPKAKK